MPCLDLCRIAAATIRARARASAWCICSSCSSSAPWWQQQQQQYTTSVQLIGKWQEILSNVKHEQHVNAPILQADNLRQLLNDAIHVYKTEGAAAVVPDQVGVVNRHLFTTVAAQCQHRSCCIASGIRCIADLILCFSTKKEYVDGRKRLLTCLASACSRYTTAPT
jgi:hypothetical protein